MNALTPLQDADQKIDIIDHVNQDHTDEIVTIAEYHQRKTGAPYDIATAKILDIYQEAMQISVCFSQNGETEILVIPFEIEGELEDKILYSAYAAVVKQGRDFSGMGKRFYEVVDKQQITTNMLRLQVKSNVPLPDNYPGYAFGFLLKTMKQRPENEVAGQQSKSWSKNLFDRLFIWLMKRLSNRNRQKLIQSANKDIRLYTLRKSWKSDAEASFADHGYIDIFTHGGTAGSRWAESLAVGDVIMSRSQAEDRHPHLLSGQALLIADETAFPALAGILEHWQNPLPPQVILLSATQDEQAYFSEEVDGLNQGGSVSGLDQVYRVVCPPESQGGEVLAIIQQLASIDVVWAAFESSSAKTVRHYLRNERQIVGKNNHTKAYWVLK